MIGELTTENLVNLTYQETPDEVSHFKRSVSTVTFDDDEET